MFTTAIITISDSCATLGKQDLSGAKIAEILQKDGDFSLFSTYLLPDEKDMIITRLRHLCDTDAVNFIVTTGGTGFSPRDVTPEATLAVLDRQACGVAEAIRYNSMQYTERAMLSRAVCGIRKNTLILNLPGSPKAVDEALSFILPSLKHGLNIMLNHDSNCAKIVRETL